MKIQPLRKVIDRPVGYVVDSRRIIGEWIGERWDDVPRKAALYVNARIDIHDRIINGDLTASVWYRANGRPSRISSWIWESPSGNVHKLYHLEGALDNVPIGFRFPAIVEFVDMVREAGANVGSLSGMMGSIERATITTTVRVPLDLGIPANRLWRGSRIQKRSGIQAHFGPTNLWDMPNAYPMRLAGLAVPVAWKEYPGHPRMDIPDEEGVAFAYVVVPPMLYGPVPDTSMRRKFPTDSELTGFWTLTELRAARDSGARVYLLRVWMGTVYRHPWRRWGNTVREMRHRAGAGARSLVKKGSVQYVGSIAAHGEVRHQRYVTPDHAETWTVGAPRMPQAVAVHGLVTARVRTDLFTDAIERWGPSFVSCHTDGALLLDDERIVVGRTSEEWRNKRKMQEVIILDAQRYAWRDYGGEWHYVFAGIPEKVLEPLFWRSWERRLKVGGSGADTVVSANNRKGAENGKR